MQSRIFSTLVLAIALMVTLAGCKASAELRSPFPRTASSGKSLPPGQAKKVYGHQSARAFAPGQQKKNSTFSDQENGNGHKKHKNKKK